MTAATATPADIGARVARLIRDAINHGHEVAHVEIVTYDPATGRAHTHTIDIEIPA